MIRTSVFSLVVCLSLFAGCGRDGVNGEDDGGTGGGVGMNGTGGGNTGTGGSAGTGGGSGSSSVTFCDVQPVIAAQCGACHGATPSSGAPQLMTVSDFAATSPRGGTMLDRSISRMTTNPPAAAMPPGVGGAASDVMLLENWRTNALAPCNPGTGGGSGAGGGSGTGGGAGTGGGSGMVTPTCASNLTWSFGNSGNGAMNPGEACVTCHAARRRGPLDGFMGTVYPSAHEATLCMVSSVPSGLSVEILDTSGVVRRSFPITSLSDGNFHGGSIGTPSPYTARVMLNGVVKSQMVGPQTNGDCNVCHTAQGAQGAPGRIHW